ncbi:MAG: alpha/beta fold hydrolase [Phycisphaerales bacterium]|nr:alpha/beta fold hydrolase [Phycisphaerales bacterium]
MSGARASLVLLPGLGADARLFGPQRRAFPDLVVPRWIEPAPGEPLAEYARRMAAAFDEPDGAYVLGGASMGGMVALEMARHLPAQAVVLIGSARSGSEVRRWLRLAESLSRPLPDAAIHAGRRLAPVGALVFSSTGPRHRGLFLDMLRGTSTRFIRWASRAVVEWQAGPMPTCPVLRIHGGQDRIITPPREGAEVVGQAGHLVNLSHAREVNALLKRGLELAAQAH